jgi:predicted RND superfamily exporter protein
MRKNIGMIDRLIRLAIGIFIIVLGLVYKSWWGALGLIPIATAIVGWCGCYALFKICTIKGCSCKSTTEGGGT